MSVVSVTLLSDGAEIRAVFELMAIDIRREVDRIPSATLIFIDGDASKGEFALSSQNYFVPGKLIEIRLRYESKPNDEATVFKGPVIRHAIEASAQGSLLRVEMKDAAVKLTQPRKSRVFREVTDGEAIGMLIGDAQLKKGTIASTQPTYKELVQYSSSDWDFMISRADVQGLATVVEDGAVSVRKVELKRAPRLHIEYGLSDIYDFDFEIDAGSQYPEIKSQGWDVAEQKATSPAVARTFALSQGDLDGAALARAVGFGPNILSDGVPLPQAELQAWADARLLRSRMAMIRGRVSIVGTAAIRLLDLVTIAGIGKHFNGKALVTGIAHRVDAGDWRTDLQFGLSPRSYSQRDGIRDAPAAGLLPAVGGLQIGVVHGSAGDPDKQTRVKVVLPGLDTKNEAVWARLAALDAGNKRGSFFRPEPGDEVIVGFFNEDPRQPVILGALYSSKNAPPEVMGEPDDKNLKKGFVTKAGTKIVFSDDQNKGSLYFETAAKNKVLLDDDNKLIEISDQHGNKITMDQNGITLKSAKDLKFSASGNVEIKGSKVDVN